jgi:hypothetical protein
MADHMRAQFREAGPALPHGLHLDKAASMIDEVVAN